MPEAGKDKEKQEAAGQGDIQAGQPNSSDSALPGPAAGVTGVSRGQLSDEQLGHGAEKPSGLGRRIDEPQDEESLDEAREKMWEAVRQGQATNDGLGVQEEETARVSDHLAFPGAGVKEYKESAGTDDIEEAVKKLSHGDETRDKESDPPGGRVIRGPQA